MSPSEPASASRRIARAGMRFIAILLAALGAAGIALAFAGPEPLRTRVVAQFQTKPTEPKPVDAKPADAALPGKVLPGFTRRGATLVGDFTGEHGLKVRFVLDAASHRLIGFKMLEPARPAP
jgi:hypothetical protein